MLINTQMLWMHLPTILSTLATLLVAWTGFKKLRLEQIALAKTAGAKVEEVRQDLLESSTVTSKKLANIQLTSDKTHAFVNGNMTAQLRKHAAACRRLAYLTQDPQDVANAEMAERDLEEHLEKQSIVILRTPEKE
jgi:hypothetical protein